MKTTFRSLAPLSLFLATACNPQEIIISLGADAGVPLSGLDGAPRPGTGGGAGQLFLPADGAQGGGGGAVTPTMSGAGGQGGTAGPITVPDAGTGPVDDPAPLARDGAAPTSTKCQVPKPPKLPSSDLVSRYMFDECEGTTAQDTQGGPSGVIHAGVRADWMMGQAGGALHLTGRDWVEVPTWSGLARVGAQNAVTVSAWVRPDAAADANATSFIVSRQEAGTAYQQFGLALWGGRPACVVHFSTAVSGGKPLPVGRWTHLAMTYDGVTCKVFQDGLEAAFLDVGWPMSSDTTPLLIGASNSVKTLDDFFVGAVDDVALWSRALAPAEIAGLAKP